MSLKWLFYTFVVLVAFIPNPSRAEKFESKNINVANRYNVGHFFEGIYSKDDVSGNEDPGIHYDFEVTSKAQATAYFVIASQNAMQHNPVIKTKEACSHKHLGFNKKESDEFSEYKVEKIEVPAPAEGETSKSVKKKGEFHVNETALYTHFWIKCEGRSAVQRTGEVWYGNADGRIPGGWHGAIPFYAWMAVLFSVLTVLWILLCAYFRQELFSHHHCITVLLILWTIELITYSSGVRTWNSTGFRPESVFSASIVFSALRRTFMRFLVIVVSLGAGIARPSVSKPEKFWLGFLCLVYLISALVQGFQLPTRSLTDDIQKESVVFLVLLVVNACMYVWLFTGLSKTLENLKQGQSFKRKLYEKFTSLLVIALLVFTAFKIYEGNYIRTRGRFIEGEWKKEWFVREGFYQIFQAFVLSIVGILWMPRKNSGKYAFSEQLPMHDPEDSDTRRLRLSTDGKSALELSEFEIDTDLPGPNVGSVSRRTTVGSEAGGRAELPEVKFSIDDFDDDLQSDGEDQMINSHEL